MRQRLAAGPHRAITDIFEVAGMRVLVTGATSGLGRHVAELLARCGATVAAIGRRRERLEDMELGESGLTMRCDVTDPDDLGELEGLLQRTWGGLDVVINNAGISVVENALMEDAAKFRRSLEVNLVAPFEVAKLGVRLMDGGGSIVNVASILGLNSAPAVPLAGYAASKGGLISLTRELAAQWGRLGVRVNALAPGWFPSEMTDEMLSDERGLGWVQGNTILGRAAHQSELDGAVLFLASTASTYVTGQCLVVDGGWTAI